MALVSVTPPKAGKSHRIRRVGRGVGDRGGPEGFRTNSGEQRRWGRAAGRTAPCAPSRRLPRAAARSGPRLPLRPAPLQPSGLRLADRGGLHLPACEPHPDPRRRRPRAPHSSFHPRSPSAPSPGPSPSPRVPRASDLGLALQQARGRGLAGQRRSVALLHGRSAASRPQRLMESRRRGPLPLSRCSTPLSPPPQSQTHWSWARLLPSPPPGRAA